MLKSIFFRRMLAMLLLALLLISILTALIYSFITRSVLTKIKVNDLLPKAYSMAQIASENYFRNDRYFNELITSSTDLFNAWVVVIDGLSREPLNRELPIPIQSAREEFLGQIEESLNRLLSGANSSLWFTGQLKSAGTGELLYIGVPIHLGVDTQNPVIGAVFFIQPLSELNAAFKSMNIALLASSLFVLAAMIWPVYWATARLVRPLRQTRDVAIAMADGQFSLRADSGQKGEIGELAVTMNRLADSLSQTISDLILERQRLEQVIEGMKDGLIAIDRTGQFTQINQAAKQLLGLGDDQKEDLHLHYKSLINLFDQVIATATPAGIQLTRNERAITVNASPLVDENTRIAGAVALLHDITEAKRLEETRRHYVANMSHELRAPLTTMRALVEPLKDKMVEDEADRQRYFAILLREIIRLSNLIDDVMELSRLQADAIPLNQRSFALGDILKDLNFKYSALTQDKDIELAIPHLEDSLPQVFADPDRVEQILIILLDNALKFTPAGGKIQLTTAVENPQLLVTVRDSGIGINPLQLEHVFDRFYKGDLSHNQSGTGLGLSIAREILQKMDQSITVESTPGQGSSFTFTLPLAKDKFYL